MVSKSSDRTSLRVKWWQMLSCKHLGEYLRKRAVPVTGCLLPETYKHSINIHGKKSSQSTRHENGLLQYHHRNSSNTKKAQMKPQRIWPITRDFSQGILFSDGSFL